MEQSLLPASSRVVPIRLGLAQAFLVRGARPILVDTGLPGRHEAILAALRQEGLAPNDLALILITHGHTDHLGSAKTLRQASGAPIAVHRLDAEAARTGQNPPLRPTAPWWRLTLLLAQQPPAPPFEPDILVDQALDLAPWGVAGRVIPTPGHTPGSLTVVLDDGQVLLGDLVRGGLFRPERPTFPFVAEDLAAVRRSLEKILALQPTRLYAAHGGPFTPEAVRRLLMTAHW